ncbi:MAG: TatD family hydrolase [Acidobacteriota bacterium]
MLTLIDSHAHLDAPELLADLPGVLERAAQAGVASILTIGCACSGADVIPQILELVEAHDNVYAGVGVHPHDARLYSESVAQEIAGAMRHPKVVGLGEIGLDYYYEHSPRARQQQVFREQLRLARSLQKPVIIHSREAADDTCAILEEEFDQHNDSLQGVFHCFTYDLETARRALKMGFYFSFGGMITFPKSHEMRRVIRELPLDRVLLETDSPYLAPVPFRGKPNQPAYTLQVAEKMAEVREISLQEVASATTGNFWRLFGIREVSSSKPQLPSIDF